MIDPDWPFVQTFVHKIWGYSSLRPAQDTLIRSGLAGEDVLGVLPTGGGKSLCFQVPALLKAGLTLVISPLLALMEDQVRRLQAQHLPVAALHHEMTRSQRQSILQSLAQHKLRLLYLSPETLLSPPVWQILIRPDLKVKGIAIDEAHCLVQWGDSFRPSYRRLGAVRPALLAAKPTGTQIAIAAFTATADLPTQKELISALQMRSPQVVTLSAYRPNLQLAVKIAWTPRCRYHLLLNQIQRHSQAAGLVYLRSRQMGEDLARQLQAQGLRIAVYHAGLSPSERRTIEAKWLDSAFSAIVCTNAFGMGVDKPDVRWIVHYHPPHQLTDYLQEIGRAGRDGKPAYALTLMSEPTGWLDPSDRQRQAYFNQQAQKLQRQALRYLKTLPPSANLTELSADAQRALALLHRLGQLQWRDPFHYQLKAGAAQASFSSLIAERKSLSPYLRTRSCRWRILLETFGEALPSKNWRCNHCDNCRQ
jgi:ATP-dependent DNA helicase RecQ